MGAGTNPGTLYAMMLFKREIRAQADSAPKESGLMRQPPTPQSPAGSRPQDPSPANCVQLGKLVRYILEELPGTAP